MLQFVIRILRPSLAQIDTEMAKKYANHRYAASCRWKIRRIMCQHHSLAMVSINSFGDLDLLPFDLEAGMRVALKVGNLNFEFGHARPLGSRVIQYVRDGRTHRRTDRRTYEQKQPLLPPFLRAGA